MALALSAPAGGGPSTSEPGARGVHGLRRHVEYPTLADTVIETGIRIKRDDLVSLRYSTELNSIPSLVTRQRTDPHGILDEKPPDFQRLSGQRYGEYSSSRLSNRTLQEQRASPGTGDGPPKWPSGVVVLGNRRGPPVAHPPGGRGPLSLWPQARGGSGNDARVFRLSSPRAACGVFAEHPAGGDGEARAPDLGDD